MVFSLRWFDTSAAKEIRRIMRDAYKPTEYDAVSQLRDLTHNDDGTVQRKSNVGKKHRWRDEPATVEL